MIKDKSDCENVNKIIAMGYPENEQYLDELLSWTCDPNWPVAGSIYEYFRELGKKEVIRVMNTAGQADQDWRYSLLMNIISHYDDETLRECVDWLRSWAKQPGSDECDFESLRILAERKLVEPEEISHIARRNLFVYNLYIKETMAIAEEAIYQFPLSDHTL